MTAAALLTDAAPDVGVVPDVEYDDRVQHLYTGINKTKVNGLDGEALETVTKAVLVDNVDCFCAGIYAVIPPLTYQQCVPGSTTDPCRRCVPPASRSRQGEISTSSYQSPGSGW